MLASDQAINSFHRSSIINNGRIGRLKKVNQLLLFSFAKKKAPTIFHISVARTFCVPLYGLASFMTTGMFGLSG